MRTLWIYPPVLAFSGGILAGLYMAGDQPEQKSLPLAIIRAGEPYPKQGLGFIWGADGTQPITAGRDLAVKLVGRRGAWAIAISDLAQITEWCRAADPIDPSPTNTSHECPPPLRLNGLIQLAPGTFIFETKNGIELSAGSEVRAQ